MKKLLVLFSVVFLISCSVQKDCTKRVSLKNVDVEPKDSVYVEVERSVETYCGKYVRTMKGDWYRISGVYNFQIGDTILVYREWKNLPPCNYTKF